MVIALLLTGFVILFVCYSYKNNLSLYEKINLSKNINILIVGDSIGGGQGSEKYFWGDLFKGYLTKTYGVNVNNNFLRIHNFKIV